MTDMLRNEQCEYS